MGSINLRLEKDHEEEACATGTPSTLARLRASSYIPEIRIPNPEIPRPEIWNPKKWGPEGDVVHAGKVLNLTI